MPRRVLLLLPLAIVVLAGAAFFFMLQGMEAGTFNPRGVPSMLMGKPVPVFDLPAQPGTAGFSSADLKQAGHPVLINFFASWCQPCIEENAVLVDLRRQGVPIWGIAYKDKEPDTARFLTQRGNPFARIVRDAPGRLAIDWGITGVPETYLIDASGVVRWRYVGPMTQDVVDQTLLPMLRKVAS